MIIMGGCIGITRSRSGPIEESSGTVSRPNSGTWWIFCRRGDDGSDQLSKPICCCRWVEEEPVAVPRDY